MFTKHTVDITCLQKLTAWAACVKVYSALHVYTSTQAAQAVSLLLLFSKREQV